MSPRGQRLVLGRRVLAQVVRLQGAHASDIARPRGDPMLAVELHRFSHHDLFLVLRGEDRCMAPARRSTSRPSPTTVDGRVRVPHPSTSSPHCRPTVCTFKDCSGAGKSKSRVTGPSLDRVLARLARMPAPGREETPRWALHSSRQQRAPSLPMHSGQPQFNSGTCSTQRCPRSSRRSDAAALSNAGLDEVSARARHSRA